MTGSLAILGGTFDPVHHGHLLLARDALEGLGVERVLLMPAREAPLRAGPPAAAAEHRLAMLRAAIAGEPAMSVSELEIRRPGPSYTIDTVLELERCEPAREILWVIGADQLARLPRWHRIRELAARVTFACAARPGHDLRPPECDAPLRIRFFDTRQMAISASDVRSRIASGLRIRWLLPDAVLSYVQEHALYRH